MKVDVPGLMAAAQKLLGLATSAQGLLAEMPPLAADPTSGGAAARLDMASHAAVGSGVRAGVQPAQGGCAPDHDRAEVRYPGGDQRGRPERVAAGRWSMARRRRAGHPGTRSADPARCAGAPAARNAAERRRLLPAGPQRLGGQGDAVSAPPRRTTGPPSTPRRSRCARWPRGAGAVGKPDRHRRTRGSAQRIRHRAQHDLRPVVRTRRARRASTPTITARRSSATPKPQEFQDADDAIGAQATGPDRQVSGNAGAAAGSTARADAKRVAVRRGDRGTSTSPNAAPAAPGRPAGGRRADGARRAAASGTGRDRVGRPRANSWPRRARPRRRQAGQAGKGRVSWRRCCPPRSARSAGMAGGMAGMAGQVPQAAHAERSGSRRRPPNQGLSGLASKNATDAELSEDGRRPQGPTSCPRPRAAAERAAVAAGGDTHPAGALGPPVTPSTSHTPPTMPAGAAPPPTTPAPAGGTAMGGMPMGMPMSGMMPHGPGRRRRRRQGARGQEGRHAAAAAHRAGDRQGLRPHRGRRRGVSHPRRLRRTPTTIRRLADR